MVVVPFAVVVKRQGNTREHCYFPLVLIIIAAVNFDEGIYACNGVQTHCCTHFSHLCVGAKAGNRVQTGETEVPYQTKSSRQIVIIRNNGPSLETVYEFRSVKAEYFRVAKAADHASFVRTSKSVRGVEEKL